MTRHLLSVILVATGCLVSNSSYALDQILRPYTSVRSAALGGVRMTTGLYEENFFNNPARVTANPESKFSVLNLMPLEFTSETLTVANSIMGGKDAIATLAENAGKNIHSRTQFVLPGYYLASSPERKFAIAFGIIGNIQTDTLMRKNYQMGLAGVADVGPALTFGYKFLDNDALSVGTTAHFTYRMGINPNYSLLDFLTSDSPSLNTIAGDGAMINFDLGSTYEFVEWGAFKFRAAVAAQNLLGGKYSNSLMGLLKQKTAPAEQPTSLAFGVASTRPEWGDFMGTTFALEFSDILNNANGSFFKCIHLGAETRWKSISMRLGINQGYFTGGLGFDFRYFTLNASTYGEEMALNVGVIEDRRYAIDLGFNIF